MKKCLMSIILAVLLMISMLVTSASATCPEGEHNWANAVITKQASCETDGILTLICSKCGETKTQTIPKLGHDWVIITRIKQPQSYGGFGECRCRCANCGIEKTRLVTYCQYWGTAHEWDEGEIIKEATETEEGLIRFICKACRDTKTETIPKLTPAPTPTSTPTPTPAPPMQGNNPFKDVTKDAYYYDAVLWAVSHEPQITNGTGPNTFSPVETCTRGQVVTFLWRASGMPTPKNTNNPFNDISKDAYYYKAVLWAVEKGITNGTSATTFNPNEPCTRAHVVTFLYRSNGSPKLTSAYNPFKDISLGQYYADAVLWAVSRSITNGTSATAFSPSAPCTRGQIVTFLYRDKGQ